QRRFTVFSLSFLDIMSCGFGATVLVFMLIHHSTLDRSDDINAELLIELQQLEEQIERDREFLITSEQQIQSADTQIIELQARVSQILEETGKARDELADRNEMTMAQRESVERMMADIRALEARARRLEGAAEEKRLAQLEARSFLGTGSRQYLTGLRLGGRNILIMLDSSASMLDSTLVNIIRRRNMPLERKLEGPKWQRSVQTVEWLLTNLPETADFQVYHFNETAGPVIDASEGRWFAANDEQQIAQVASALRQLDPGNGTSLINALSVIGDMDPMPDNIILITDGLPTIGVTPNNRRTISARNRLRLFRRALDELPFGIPVNTILMPIEGDPAAASQYWRLAMVTGGSFMSPSRDWP
ncbi:MAG: VWA domain-containing protein, partial [Gammaproteobacteria bacterium]|nr:VWA domain-containing protein [Gammaproteobacteria bacterium]